MPKKPKSVKAKLVIPAADAADNDDANDDGQPAEKLNEFVRREINRLALMWIKGTKSENASSEAAGLE